MVSLFIEEIVTLGLFDFQREFGFLEEGFKIWFSVGKAETLFTLEGDVDPVGVLPFGAWVDVGFDIFFLPEARIFWVFSPAIAVYFNVIAILTKPF